MPRHTDSAEETIVVTAGAVEVLVGDERAELPSGGIAVVPADVPHEVQPDGSRERQTVA